MTVMEVFEKINKDSELMAKIKDMKTPEEVYELAKEQGLDMSFEDFKAEVYKINESVSKLSETELDAINGGGDTITTTYATIFTMCAVAAI